MAQLEGKIAIVTGAFLARLGGLSPLYTLALAAAIGAFWKTE